MEFEKENLKRKNDESKDALKIEIPQKSDFSIGFGIKSSNRRR